MFDCPAVDKPTNWQKHRQLVLRAGTLPCMDNDVSPYKPLHMHTSVKSLEMTGCICERSFACFVFLPSTASSLTGMPCRWDMYPKAEKMTNPDRMLVRELMMDIVRVSLWGERTSLCLSCYPEVITVTVGKVCVVGYIWVITWERCC